MQLCACDATPASILQCAVPWVGCLGIHRPGTAFIVFVLEMQTIALSRVVRSPAAEITRGALEECSFSNYRIARLLEPVKIAAEDNKAVQPIVSDLSDGY